MKSIAKILDEKTGKEISEILKNQLQKVAFSGMNGFSTGLGKSSDYHNVEKYVIPNPLGYRLPPEANDLKDICNKVVSTKDKIIKLLEQGKGLDSISDIAQEIWTTASKFWTSDNGIMERSSILKQKTIQTINDLNTLALEVMSLKNQITNYENTAQELVKQNKTLFEKESWNSATHYGDFLIQNVLEKAKKEENTLREKVTISIEGVLNDYFVSENQGYNDKINVLKRNIDRIDGNLKNIEDISNEAESFHTGFLEYTKKQNKKIGGCESLINKSKDFEKGTQDIIEKNKMLYIGEIKDKSSEMFTITKSLGLMFEDKIEQIGDYKDLIQSTRTSFKDHENTLTTAHEKHVGDVKEIKDKVLETNEKFLKDRERRIEHLELENKNLHAKFEDYEKQINHLKSEATAKEFEFQTVNYQLPLMMMMLGFNMEEFKELKGAQLVQQCFMKVMTNNQTKK